MNPKMFYVVLKLIYFISFSVTLLPQHLFFFFTLKKNVENIYTSEDTNLKLIQFFFIEIKIFTGKPSEYFCHLLSQNSGVYSLPLWNTDQVLYFNGNYEDLTMIGKLIPDKK